MRTFVGTANERGNVGFKNMVQYQYRSEGCETIYTHTHTSETVHSLRVI